MLVLFSPRWTIVVALALPWLPLLGQRTGPPLGTPPNRPSPAVPGSDAARSRPLYVSGKVLLEGGLIPTEPLEIQRVCSGSARREGFTNAKGEFQLQLGVTILQDASESDAGGGTSTQLSRSPSQLRQFQYQGCELRAVLPGFQSTSVPIRIEDDFGETSVGTIVLSRLGNVEGSTISLTGLTAPKEARDAYERGRKAQAQKKLAEAEKELNKAVQIYPRYAAAWDLLGTIHQDGNPDLAAKEFSESIASDKQFVNPYFGMAVIALKQKKWAEVQGYTDQVLRLNGYAFPLAHLYNGAANYYLGRMEAAEQSARRFQSLDTDHRRPDVSLLLADILEAKKDYAGAVQQLRVYLTLVPSSPHASEIKADVERLESLRTQQE
jgi:Tfp pilus assembly protein PilF